ncbi:Crp/Fnr family transcriptional regulator [Chryseobacterium chendengshani]|uniref:Crp/Fnr family transcriptional regulator n=1 Tax=Chryseobacterium sp. LJ756 TaxID=2864113 RepID=UPI001C642FD7|nr:Crp/Fnr family transcriptional regulator [Chryseobacterium sp. LJ756]MBW7675656.1 Crp/Fnr family transcriptional regulator [Chryseobacterium sp. LJ756]
MKKLFDYINSHSAEGISEQDFELVKKYFIPKRLRKKQYFLQEGEVCKYFGFILSGAMRQYTLDEKGSEHILQLAVEDWWVGDRESWTLSKPSIYNIDAWEDTELLLMSHANLLELVQRFPAFAATKKMMDDRNNIASQRRITSTISSTAEKRYTTFLDCYPELAERFPQQQIASYLGMTKDTLSRIKGKLMR